MAIQIQDQQSNGKNTVPLMQRSDKMAVHSVWFSSHALDQLKMTI
jgi:hypothetical protein